MKKKQKLNQNPVPLEQPWISIQVHGQGMLVL